MATNCVACRCVEAASPDLSRDDAIAFGAICGLIEAVRFSLRPRDLCTDHKQKLALLESVGTFGRAVS